MNRLIAPASPLVVLLVASLAAGRPYGWIGFLLPLGPLALLISARLRNRTEPFGVREVLAFSVVAGALIGIGWSLTQVAGTNVFISVLFPVGLAAFLIGTVNFLAVTMSRMVRARKGEELDYPWIPDALAALLGAPVERSV